MSLNMNGEDIIVLRTPWYSEFEDRVLDKGGTSSRVL